MNPYALLPLSGFVVNLALSAAVLVRSPRGSANRLYALLALSLSYWCAIKFAARLSPDEHTAHVLFRLSAPGWCLLPSLYFHFVLVFTSEKEPRAALRRLAGGLHLVGLAFAASAAVPGLLAERMTLQPWGFVHVPGPAYRAFSVYFVSVFVVVLVWLAIARARMHDPVHRSQALFLFAGLLFPLVGGFVTNMYLPMRGRPVVELGEILSTVNAGLVAYAMVRYQLLSVGLQQAAETIISTMGEVVLVLDREGRVVLANEAASRTIGRPATELSGRRVQELLRLPDSLANSPVDGWVGQVIAVESELVPADGEAVPILLSMNRVLLGGRPMGTVLVARDIRELRATLKALEEANRRLEQQAVTDPLTGAWNRRYTLQRLASEMASTARDGGVFTVGLLDVDDFKLINDRHGHEIGDQVLREIVACLRDSVRQNDVVARWGGDELLLVLVGQDAAQAEQTGARLLTALSAIRIEALPSPVTVSLGLATHGSPNGAPQPGETLEALIGRADAALYRAKRDGKARVAMAPPP